MHKNNDQKLSQNILSMLIAVGNSTSFKRRNLSQRTMVQHYANDEISPNKNPALIWDF